MNDPFVHEQAMAFAVRIRSTTKTEDERIRVAFETALGRLSTTKDREEVSQFLKAYRKAVGGAAEKADLESWAAFVRTLFARNEFLFVQ